MNKIWERILKIGAAVVVVSVIVLLLWFFVFKPPKIDVEYETYVDSSSKRNAVSTYQIAQASGKLATITVNKASTLFDIEVDPSFQIIQVTDDTNGTTEFELHLKEESVSSDTSTFSTSLVIYKKDSLDEWTKYDSDLSFTLVRLEANVDMIDKSELYSVSENEITVTVLDVPIQSEVNLVTLSIDESDLEVPSEATWVLDYLTNTPENIELVGEGQTASMRLAFQTFDVEVCAFLRLNGYTFYKSPIFKLKSQSLTVALKAVDPNALVTIADREYRLRCDDVANLNFSLPNNGAFEYNIEEFATLPDGFGPLTWTASSDSIAMQVGPDSTSATIKIDESVSLLEDVIFQDFKIQVRDPQGNLLGSSSPITIEIIIRDPDTNDPFFPNITFGTFTNVSSVPQYQFQIDDQYVTGSSITYPVNLLQPGISVSGCEFEFKQLNTPVVSSFGITTSGTVVRFGMIEAFPTEQEDIQMSFQLFARLNGYLIQDELFYFTVINTN